MISLKEKLFKVGSIIIAIILVTAMSPFIFTQVAAADTNTQLPSVINSTKVRAKTYPFSLEYTRVISKTVSPDEIKINTDKSRLVDMWAASGAAVEIVIDSTLGRFSFMLPKVLVPGYFTPRGVRVGATLTEIGSRSATFLIDGSIITDVELYDSASMLEHLDFAFTLTVASDENKAWAENIRIYYVNHLFPLYEREVEGYSYYVYPDYPGPYFKEGLAYSTIYGEEDIPRMVYPRNMRGLFTNVEQANEAYILWSAKYSTYPNFSISKLFDSVSKKWVVEVKFSEPSTEIISPAKIGDWENWLYKEHEERYVCAGSGTFFIDNKVEVEVVSNYIFEDSYDVKSHHHDTQLTIDWIGTELSTTTTENITTITHHSVKSSRVTFTGAEATVSVVGIKQESLGGYVILKVIRGRKGGVLRGIQWYGSIDEVVITVRNLVGEEESFTYYNIPESPREGHVISVYGSDGDYIGNVSLHVDSTPPVIKSISVS